MFQEHLAKHAGDKPYKCEVCPKQFNHKTDLRRHMCLHTGEKPFTCDVCGKGFIREDRMVKHADTHKKKAAHVAGGMMWQQDVYWPGPGHPHIWCHVAPTRVSFCHWISVFRAWWNRQTTMTLPTSRLNYNITYYFKQWSRPWCHIIKLPEQYETMNLYKLFLTVICRSFVNFLSVKKVVWVWSKM